ncbi:MAG TPA: hypothetical protein VJ976_01895 [Ornithinimicrobium sp.]|uniref:hypothetical protein n=1 Tax=Ornithinimicrobium sp. TaxID=1977084 RepID=UPI002B4A16EB|nr:hypothetical protein [Ornithinimicrobium sp.]HKJ11123.1 hypothetical protein [Ornithinimicrobium sp.]
MQINWLEVLGWTGSVVLVISLLQTRILRLRLINLAGSLILAFYNVVIEVWPMVGLNVVLSLINVFYLVTMLRTRHDPTVYTVLEVDPDDRYLQHLLSVHSEDIHRSFPGFTEVQAHQSAFLIVHGDEAVGVVVIEDAEPGVAQIVLDWVTLRYRDSTPGEFVFRRSEIFSRRGYSRVVTAPETKEAYYPRIGFTPDGDRYALDVS